MNIYDTSALYAQNMSEGKQKRLMEFYEDVFKGHNVNTIHDCSIGAGGTTLPLARLGYKVSGSDMSQNLLAKARENFSSAGYDIELFPADFTRLSDATSDKYDCLISTGNSLPHADSRGVTEFVRGAASRLNPRGLLYIDMRNWDRILSEKPLFTARDPLIMTEHEHVSLYQIWNWHDNSSVDFVFVTSTDRNGKHYKTSFTYAPTYYPLKYKEYQAILDQHGFVVRRCFDLDSLWMPAHEVREKTGVFESDFSAIGWYGVLAQKVD